MNENSALLSCIAIQELPKDVSAADLQHGFSIMMTQPRNPPAHADHKTPYDCYLRI
jgi:hypothetical protein